MDRCGLTTSALSPAKCLACHLPPRLMGQEVRKSINVLQLHEQSNGAHVPGPGREAEHRGRINFSVGWLCYLLAWGQPWPGEKGKESTRKNSGSGSVWCTASSKEWRCMEDLSLHRRPHPSSTCTRIKYVWQALNWLCFNPQLKKKSLLSYNHPRSWSAMQSYLGWQGGS